MSTEALFDPTVLLISTFVGLPLAALNAIKGKYVLMVLSLVGIVLPVLYPAAWAGAVRLAKPGSWLYNNYGDPLLSAQADRRYEDNYTVKAAAAGVALTVVLAGLVFVGVTTVGKDFFESDTPMPGQVDVQVEDPDTLDVPDTPPKIVEEQPTDPDLLP